MFVQVIQGRTSDPEAMRAQSERWRAELGPGADGWLGSTAGVTDDGRAIAIVRFESAEAAERNSSRPEQGAWWEQMAATYDGEPTFQNHTLVDIDTYGDPDSAGFVQVMQGKVSDVHRGLELMKSDSTDWAAFRPDILATTWSGSDDGSWTMAIYFTSEAAAREGEQKEEPPEAKALMEELNALAVGEPTFLDIREPWFMSPG